MKIPIKCEHCGGLIATFDTTKDTDAGWAEAPCGEKVCKECCDECAKNHELESYNGCMYRNEAGIGRK